MKIALCIAICSLSPLGAMSLRLHNESPCPLKAIIYSADGSFLQQLTLQEQESLLWNDTKSSSSIQSNRSKTPFTVYWICPDGEVFGVIENVSTGAFISSGQGFGKKNCGGKP